MGRPGSDAVSAILTGRFLFVVSLLVCVVGCAGPGGGGTSVVTAVTEMGLETRPTHLEVSLGGFTGPSYRIELQDDGSILYLHNPTSFTSGPRTKKRRIQVTEAQWRQFRGALEEAEVWDWKEEYIDPGILDGTQWLVRIKYDDASVFSRGSNSSPPGGRFKRLRGAVVELIGGLEFK